MTCIFYTAIYLKPSRGESAKVWITILYIPEGALAFRKRWGLGYPNRRVSTLRLPETPLAHPFYSNIQCLLLFIYLHVLRTYMFQYYKKALETGELCLGRHFILKCIMRQEICFLRNPMNCVVYVNDILWKELNIKLYINIIEKYNCLKNWIY